MASMILQPFIAKLVEWRVALLICGITLGVLAYFPSQHLQFDRTIENMFAPDDPLLLPYLKLKRTFGGNEVLLAAYADPHLMSPEGMNRLRDLGDQLAKVPGVLSVLAINRGPLGDEVADESNPLARSFVNLFQDYTVSADRKIAGVAVMLDPRSTVARSEIVDQMRTIVEKHDSTGMLVGEPVMLVDGFRYLEQDGFLLGVVSTSLLVLTIIVCFRSVRWVLVPLIVVQLTLLLTRATLALSGIKLSMVSSMLTAIVTIVGISATVHLIVRFRELRAEGRDPRGAFIFAGVTLAVPIFWSMVTDVAGFGSLLLAKAGPVQDFGLMTMIGSQFVLVSLILLAPGLALIGKFDADPKRMWGEDHLEFGLAGISIAVERRPRILGIVSGIAVAVAAIGIFRLEVETEFTKNFRAGSPVVRSYEFVETHLGGAGVWEIIVPAPEKIDSAFLEKLARLEKRLRTEVRITDANGQQHAGLTKVLSVADVFAATPAAMATTLPIAALRDRAVSTALEQMHTQMPDFMGALVGRDPADENRPYARIMLRSLERQPAETRRSLINDVERISREEFPEAEVTGFFVLLTNLVLSTTRDQWTTFASATGGIFFMGLLAFRSFRLALIALVPNALPIFMVTGLMGWLGLKINMGAAMIASVSMGLSVDSSMHYITDYLHQRRAGKTVHQAIAMAHQSVGRAMVFSTLALVIGFSALCLSQFVPTIYFGALVGLTMLGGLAGNLIVLPLLLAVTERSSRTKPDVAAAS